MFHPVVALELFFVPPCTGHVILSAGKNGLVAVSSPVNGATIRVIKDHKGAMITTIQCVIEQVSSLKSEQQKPWQMLETNHKRLRNIYENNIETTCS